MNLQELGLRADAAQPQKCMGTTPVIPNNPEFSLVPLFLLNLFFLVQFIILNIHDPRFLETSPLLHFFVSPVPCYPRALSTHAAIRPH